MRLQASIEALTGIFLVLTLITLVITVFIQSKESPGVYEEIYGSRQICYQIRNMLINTLESGIRSRIDLPRRLNYARYNLRFIDGYLNIQTEEEITCKLPAIVYNQTDGTDFVVEAGEIIFYNIDGKIYLEAYP